MSRDFYFNKWKETLITLKRLVDKDVELQETKQHDQTLSDAVLRLSGILGQYLLMYNDVMECLQQNLQVQKTENQNNIIQGIVSRIIELKQQLSNLEGSNFQFIGHGLIEVQHTIRDIELKSIPMVPKRPEHIQKAYDDIVKKVEEARETKAAEEELANQVEERESTENEVHWWDTEEIKLEKERKEREKQKQAELEAIPEEIRKPRQYLALIFAHEKTRQVLCQIRANKLKRERWEKELQGVLPPPAPYKMREKSAKMIQEVCRAYLESKRNKIKNLKRDQLLGLIICDVKNIDVQRKKAEDVLENRVKKYTTYEKEWIARRESLYEMYLKLHRDRLCEESADQIREWFLEWFETVQFFHDIPNQGCAAIFNGLVPDPLEWAEENKKLKLQNEANKNKSSQDLKFEKAEAKRQVKMLKKEEQMRLKTERLLLEKMMKHPTMHPGYYYPASKRTKNLQLVVDQYYKKWDMYDVKETLDVKEKYVHEIALEDAIAAAKVEVLPDVDPIMRVELQQLQAALKTDYENNEEDMPVDYTKPIKSKKHKKIHKVKMTESAAEAIEFLVANGFIVDYPKTKLQDYIGDPNFGGEDLRSQIRPALPLNYEIRAFWWDVCREVSLGFRKILLVGPTSSGKTTLVHALATTNNAILIELDARRSQEFPHFEFVPTECLKWLIHRVYAAARVLQPTVIYIKHVEKLFYSKIPPEEENLKLDIVKLYFIQKLFKKIKKTDMITVVGSCVEPWLAKSRTMLQQFPTVLLLPNTTYSLVVQMLKEWVLKHPVIPPDFSVSNLAYMLQGYTYGNLKDVLERFLTAERVIKIAAHGLTPNEVYDFILDDEKGVKVEYDKYLKWYSEKTASGKRERQHLADQLEFKENCEIFAEKEKKKRPKSAKSNAANARAK